MATHRGLNLSSIAHEGLEGLPGVLIAVFFVFCGTLMLFELFAPAFTKHSSYLLTVVYLVVSVAACIAYVLSQRHDRRLSAELEQQFHELNIPGRQGELPTTSAAVDAVTAGAPGRAPEPRRPEADQPQIVAPPDALAPEGVLGVVVWFFFLWGMMAMFVAPENQSALLSVFAAISGGIVIASIFLRVRNHWRARRVERGPY